MTKNLEFLDVLNILGFAMNYQNLQENLTQGDKQDLMREVDQKTTELLEEIKSYLAYQDKKLDEILNILKSR